MLVSRILSSPDVLGKDGASFIAVAALHQRSTSQLGMDVAWMCVTTATRFWEVER